MPRRNPKAKELTQTIAKQRMLKLISFSESAIRDGNLELSRRYSLMASRIQSHYRIRPSLRNKVCKQCKTLLVPGVTASVRLSSKNRYIVLKCLLCGKESHKVYKKQGTRTLGA